MYKYFCYEIESGKEPWSVPFDRIVNYLNSSQELGCYIFADNCTRKAVEFWQSDASCTVHWFQDITPTRSILNKHTTVTNGEKFAAIVEVKFPIDVAHLHGLYYPDGDAVGSLFISKYLELPDGIIEVYSSILQGDNSRNNFDLFLELAFHDWALLEYVKGRDEDEMIGRQYRREYVSIPVDGTPIGFKIDWGTLIDESVFEKP